MKSSIAGNAKIQAGPTDGEKRFVRIQSETREEYAILKAFFKRFENQTGELSIRKIDDDESSFMFAFAICWEGGPLDMAGAEKILAEPDAKPTARPHGENKGKTANAA